MLTKNFSLADRISCDTYHLILENEASPSEDTVGSDQNEWPLKAARAQTVRPPRGNRPREEIEFVPFEGRDRVPLQRVESFFPSV